MTFWKIPSANKVYKLPRNAQGFYNKIDFSHIIYMFDELKSQQQDRERFINCNFSNVSLSKTIIKNIEFSKCKFNKCLFINTVFQNCKFDRCNFDNCNFHEVDFDNCYIDPRSVNDEIYIRKYENIATHLYQNLMNNSKNQNQTAFEIFAHRKFRYWQRMQINSECDKLIERMNKIKSVRALPKKFCVVFDKLQSIFRSKVYALTSYYGTSWILFLVTMAVIFLLISKFSFHYQIMLGLSVCGDLTFRDCLYFVLISCTTLGYGDIAPKTENGRIFASLLPVLGLLMFAFLTSIFTKRFAL